MVGLRASTCLRPRAKAVGRTGHLRKPPARDDSGKHQPDRLWFWSMKTLQTLAVSACLIVVTATTASLLAGGGQAPAQGQQGRGQPAAPPPPQAGHPSGKLVIWGDIALFTPPDAPDNCILTNRFKRGQRVGFRMTAIDGGTSEVELRRQDGRCSDALARRGRAVGPGAERLPALAGRALDRVLDGAGRCRERQDQLHRDGDR
jgi:hypothetical protein